MILACCSPASVEEGYVAIICHLHFHFISGEFGVVYKAHLQWHRDATTEVVAVKTLRGMPFLRTSNSSIICYAIPSGLFTPNDVDNLVQEVLKMHTFSHHNVMPLTGVCLDAGGGPAVVMPYMDNGSVLHYLKKERGKLVPPNDADCSVVCIVKTVSDEVSDSYCHSFD